MFRALSTIVLAIGIMSVSAWASSPAQSAPADRAPEATAPDLLLKTPPDSLKVRTLQSTVPVETVALIPAGNQAGKAGSGWSSWGTLVATLALIGAIGVRRYKPGKH